MKPAEAKKAAFMIISGDSILASAMINFLLYLRIALYMSSLKMKTCFLVVALIIFGPLVGGLNAALYSVSLNDSDGYQISGTVDTSADIFTIDSWSDPGGSTGWLPDNAFLPITLTARTISGVIFDVPDSWNGTISSSWGFISDLSNDALGWVEGDYTEPNRHFGWGGGISSSGGFNVDFQQDRLQWTPTSPTAVLTFTLDQVSVSLVPEPSSALLLGLGALGLLASRRRIS